MPDRHYIRLDGERGQKRTLENSKNWFLPYQKFISEHGKIWNYPHLKVDFVSIVPLGAGDTEGATIFPWLIKLSYRVMTCLFQNTLHKEGLFILFRQVAYAEFWQKDLLFWKLKWWWNKRPWREKAENRASELLEIWYKKYKRW